MTNLSKVISVTTLGLFLAVWMDLLPQAIDRAASFAIAPLVLILVLIITGGGLRQSFRKAFKLFSLLVLVLVICFTAYYILQGGIGAVFPVFFGGLACAGMYVILLIIEAGVKVRSHYAPNK